MANYAQNLQPELPLSGSKLLTVSVDNYLNTLEHRHAVGAFWPFLCDYERKVINQLEIQDVTDKRYSPVALPYTFVLKGNREIHKIYNGWWYVGRPRVEELRQDLRAMMGRGTKSDQLPAQLQAGQAFPNLALANHLGERTKLSEGVAGWPTAVIVTENPPSPADQQQLAAYVTYLQPDMRSGYFNLVTISVGDAQQTRDLRQALGAEWPFLFDENGQILALQDLADIAPYTFIVDADLTLYKSYDGQHFVDRPTVEELRQDFRELISRRDDYAYDDTWDYHAIHSDTRFELTHGMMDVFHPRADDKG